MSLRVICFDPGDHTGWIFRDDAGRLQGGTVFHGKNIWQDIFDLRVLMDKLKPDVIVYETFHLYPGAAAHLAHNEFYPVQIIGVLLTIAYHVGILPERVVRQAPSVKRFSGGLDQRWKNYVQEHPGDADRTEHTKDAYLHLRYFELFNERKIK